MRKCGILAGILAVAAFAGAGCGSGKGDSSGTKESVRESVSESSSSGETGETGKYDQLTSWAKLKGNKRNYTAADFLSPANEYRMMPVLNDDPTKPKGSSIPNLERLKEYGYGGVVMNVGYSDDYLTNDYAWDLFNEAAEYAIEELGLRVGIYDEYWYPSGGARNLVLKDNPEWQAQGLATKTAVVSAGKSVSIPLPAEHTLLSAKAYNGNGTDKIDLSSATDCEIKNGIVSYKNNSSVTQTVVALYSKNWYEGTHPQYNLMESRRYIDLLRSEPTKKFLDVTYEAYKRNVGKYFGNGIEFFFYDEPALPSYKGACSVLNVLDRPNENMPKLATVCYSPGLIGEFEKDWGYDPSAFFPYLYKNGNKIASGEEAKRFRMQYYSTVSRLVADNFFGQIGEWCGRNNVKASGHMLAEETLSDVVLCSGNIMRDYAKVQMPGIDLLSGDPAVTLNWAQVMKTCSSVAQFYGRNRVFCEISDWGYQNEDWNARIASVAVQYLTGINNFVSYYDPFSFSAEQNRNFADSVARIGYMLGGGAGEKSVAVYYPIEGAYSVASNGDLGSGGNAELSSMSSGYASLLSELTRNNVDYMLFDAAALRESKIENGKIITPAGEEMTTLIVPETYALYSDVAELMLRAAESGVKVRYSFGDLICEDGAKQISFANTVKRLTENRNAKKVQGIGALISEVKSLGETCFADTDVSGVIGGKQVNENNSVYLFVNTLSSDAYVTVTLTDADKTFRVWDIASGTVSAVQTERKGNNSTYKLKMPGYGVLIITAE